MGTSSLKRVVDPIKVLSLEELKRFEYVDPREVLIPKRNKEWSGWFHDEWEFKRHPQMVLPERVSPYVTFMNFQQRAKLSEDEMLRQWIEHEQGQHDPRVTGIAHLEEASGHQKLPQYALIFGDD